MPAASARSATGERVILRPRPDRASGRVRTATTSWSEASSASSEGMAGAGVPANRSLSGGSPSRAAAVPAVAGDGQAALGPLLRLLVDLRHVGVDQVPDLTVDIPGEDAQADPDLRRRETGAA